MSTTNTDKNEAADKKQKYLDEIRNLEDCGEREFNDGLTFKEAISILPDHKCLPYQIDAYIRGYWRGWEKKLCVDNPEYLNRRNSLKFSQGTEITAIFRVLDEDQTPALLGAMYHHDDPSYLIGGCEVLSISKGDLRKQIEEIRQDVYGLVEKHNIVGVSGR